MKTHTVLFLALALATTAAGCNGCDDQAPPPLPAPKAKANAVPDPDLELEPEDAGVEEDADAGRGKPGSGGTARPSGLGPCCSALRQNAASNPEPQAGQMRAAAALCSGMVSSGKSKSSILGSVRAALAGMNMPSSCR